VRLAKSIDSEVIRKAAYSALFRPPIPGEAGHDYD
jgi:hypothetical protein